jgi:hypothetical protein
MHFACYFSLVLCVCHTSAKSVFHDIEQDNTWPRFLSLEDSRADGISHEINRALVAEHLKATKHSNTLEDLMKPGAQHISLSYWDDWTCNRADNFLQILNDTNVSTESTWRIDVHGRWGYAGNMTLLAEVIRTLPAITEVHWDSLRLIPSIVLESLQTNHPTCYLYYTIPFSTFDGDGGVGEELPYNTNESPTEQNILRVKAAQEVIKATTPQSILNKKNLYSLKAFIEYAGAFPSAKLDLVHQVLLTCPNIRELDLKIKIPRCGSSDVPDCCQDPSINNVLAFDFAKHDGVLPPLEVLRLEGYRFDFEFNGTYADPGVNKPLEMANLNAWLEHMDWSRLRSLHLSDPLTQTLHKLFADTLPSLRHFGIDGGDLEHIRAPVFKYLTKLPSLESLAIEDSEFRDLDSLLTIIAEQHTTLRSLKLNHQRDGPRDAKLGNHFWVNHFQYSTNTFLSSAQLTRLFDICPNLQSLDLDIQTALGWNYEILDTLLSFPRLKELTLRFPPEMASQYFGGFYVARQDAPELRVAMTGLRNYLKRRKVGEPFETLRTFLGWKEYRDNEGDEEETMTRGLWLQ